MNMRLIRCTDPVLPGRTYRYYTGTPTFPAFSGISLTTFNTTEESHADLKMTLRAGDMSVEEPVTASCGMCTI